MKAMTLANGLETLVDDEDYDVYARWSWRLLGRPGHEHVGRTFRGGHVYLHRAIMGHPVGVEIDHIDCDRLNNTRANLRTATHRQNMQNMPKRYGTSQYKGVHWEKREKRTGGWRAQIRVNGQRVYLGLYRDEAEAARAYDAAAQKHFGEFARINFPESAAEQAGRVQGGVGFSRSGRRQ